MAGGDGQVAFCPAEGLITVCGRHQLPADVVSRIAAYSDNRTLVCVGFPLFLCFLSFPLAVFLGYSRTPDEIARGQSSPCAHHQHEPLQAPL